MTDPTPPAAEVIEAFVVARLDEDEADCRTQSPERRYHDPAWGLRLVEVLRGLLATTREWDIQPHWNGYQINSYSDSDRIQLASPHGHPVGPALSWDEFRARYMLRCPPSKTLLTLAATWSDHPDYQTLPI